MKIYHEAPNDVFEDVQNLTDGDYALCHLLEEGNIAYVNHFINARRVGREIMLDNSVYELGEAVSFAVLYRWSNILEPDWLFLPDVMHNAVETIANAHKYIMTYDIPKRTKLVGVIQGNDYQEVVECYKALAGICDMLAFNFQLGKWFDHSFQGRVKTLLQLEEDNIIRKDKLHHLLGLKVPKELLYHMDREYIYSIDTSQPVMWGLSAGEYTNLDPLTCSFKMPGKLYNHVNRETSFLERAAILSNIKSFRAFVRGEEDTNVAATS